MKSITIKPPILRRRSWREISAAASKFVFKIVSSYQSWVGNYSPVFKHRKIAYDIYFFQICKSGIRYAVHWRLANNWFLDTFPEIRFHMKLHDLLFTGANEGHPFFDDFNNQFVRGFDNKIEKYDKHIELRNTLTK